MTIPLRLSRVYTNATIFTMLQSASDLLGSFLINRKHRLHNLLSYEYSSRFLKLSLAVMLRCGMNLDVG